MPSAMTAARRPHMSTGFTLIEVMVALVIMALIAMMSWQGVDGIVRTRAASEQRLEQTLRLNSVLAQWTQDLSAVQDSHQPQVPPFRFDGISARMTRRTPEGLQVVVWSVRNGQLLRWTSPAVTNTVALKETWTHALDLIGNEAGQLRSLSGIAEWQLYCFYDNAWSNCQSSAGAAQGQGGSVPSPTGPLPDGVRLVVSFAEGSGTNGFVTREVSLKP